MIKGKCTIELRNEDGSLAQKTEDHNMVTNFLTNMLNQDLETAMGLIGVKTQYTRYVYTPLIDNAIGGLFLFGETLEENRDCKICKTPIIGHASSNYDYSTTSLGIFNTAESHILLKEDGTKKGFKYVWDFATDRANGTIKCAALTTGVGGTKGDDSTSDTKIKQSILSYPYTANYYYALNVFETSTGNYLFSNNGSLYYTGDPKQWSCSYTNDQAFPIGKFGDDVIFVNAMSTTSVTLSIRHKSSTIGLFKSLDTLYDNTNEITKKTITFNDPIFSNMLTSYVVDGCELFTHYYCDSHYMYFPYVSNNTISIYKVDPHALELLEVTTETLNTSNLLSDTSALYFDGYYYTTWFRDTGVSGYNHYTYEIIKIKKNDVNDIVPIYTIGSSQYSTNNYWPKVCVFSIYDDTVFILSDSYPRNYSGSSLSGFIIKGNKLVKHSSELMIPINFDGLEFPYMAFFKAYATKSTNKTCYLCIAIYNQGLITIDNLSTPIVKNSTQTMKITYEITDAE